MMLGLVENIKGVISSSLLYLKKLKLQYNGGTIVNAWLFVGMIKDSAYGFVTVFFHVFLFLIICERF